MHAKFRSLLPLGAVALLLLLAACETRSISNSAYDDRSANHEFRGELNEWQVLGVASTEAVSEEAIASAMSRHAQFALRPGSSVVLIQSGARYPDSPMHEQMRRSFHVIPMSGIPDRAGYARDTEGTSPLGSRLRLAAAQAGADTLIVYWGQLEIVRDGHAGRAVSWIPLVGWTVPDETRHARVTLKAAVIDVATGNWQFVTAAPQGEEAGASPSNRRDRDRELVALVKEEGYAQLASAINERFLQ